LARDIEFEIEVWIEHGSGMRVCMIGKLNGWKDGVEALRNSKNGELLARGCEVQMEMWAHGGSGEIVEISLRSLIYRRVINQRLIIGLLLKVRWCGHKIFTNVNDTLKDSKLTKLQEFTDLLNGKTLFR